MVTNIDAKGEKTVYVYSGGYLVATIDPTGTTNMTYTYDAYGRIHTKTDSEGYTLTYSYDNLDRVTAITYPDGTSNSTTYTYLDPTQQTDRLGRTTTTTYDALRRKTSVTDMLEHTTYYNWCSCGSLAGITDPLGHTTGWKHDIQGRVIEKDYPDGSAVHYTYEYTTSRLKQMTDAMGQSTAYNYYLDNDLQQVSYSNAVVATPSVTYTYDTNYNRIVTMVDGTGTNTYSYYATTNTVLGARKVQSVVGPLPNSTITYTYDQLGRVTTQAINTVTNAVTYDSLGRVTTISNALGVFTNKYIGVTPGLSTMSYPNGQLLTNTYYGEHRR